MLGNRFRVRYWVVTYKNSLIVKKFLSVAKLRNGQLRRRLNVVSWGLIYMHRPSHSVPARGGEYEMDWDEKGRATPVLIHFDPMATQFG